MGSGTSVEASMAVVSMVEEDLSGAMGAAQEATGIKQETEEGSEPHVSSWRVGLLRRGEEEAQDQGDRADMGSTVLNPYQSRADE